MANYMQYRVARSVLKRLEHYCKSAIQSVPILLENDQPHRRFPFHQGISTFLGFKMVSCTENSNTPGEPVSHAGVPNFMKGSP